MLIIVYFSTKGPFIYYLRKIVGLEDIAYNCLYTGWVGLNKFLRKIFIHEKNEKSGNFFHQYIKIISQNELTVDHDYFPYIFNFNIMPE